MLPLSGSLLPYLPVFYRSIGLSAEQTGFVIALKSLVGCVSCVFWGAFADKFQVFLLSEDIEIFFFLYMNCYTKERMYFVVYFFIIIIDTVRHISMQEATGYHL